MKLIYAYTGKVLDLRKKLAEMRKALSVGAETGSKKNNQVYYTTN